ncbi:MAG: L-histidine N(alpha)-methyltransferase [Nevskia sp.]|nr:L-histidine N(alpha)-methyltransferase [Nevskia sp.]
MIDQTGLYQLQDLEPTAAEFATAVSAGLSATPRTLPCKFFYDAAGSVLFDRICDLPEYYLTRTECRILARRAGEIAALLAPYGSLVEFGAGSASKVGLVLSKIQRPLVYVPVDISRSHLLAGAAILARSFPRLRIAPICADYTQPFELPEIAAGMAGGAAGFFPGSTIGNFAPDEATAFLARARQILGAGALMIVGADLQKDQATLHAAYNDAAGVTAAFNLNLLRRINRELGGNFDLSGFEHAARWNPGAGRVEMHLVSLRRQSVRIGEERFDFAAGETIHTENSHKYTVEGFGAMARAAGFEPVECWTDEAGLFSVHAIRAR